MNRTDRLYGLVEELRAASPGHRTAPWLAERFEVSVRTIERDLSALQQTGVPIYATPGRRGGYAVDVSHTLPPVNFTPAEATALAVALSNREATPFTDAARSALLKLMAAMADDDAAGARALAARVKFFEHEDPDGDGDGDGGPVAAAARPRAGARHVLEQAIVERRVTRISYIDKDDVTTERVVEPVAVAGVESRWYLVAWCRLRRDFRSFRLDRVLGAVLTDEVAPDRDHAPTGPPGLVGRSPVLD